MIRPKEDDQALTNYLNETIGGQYPKIEWFLSHHRNTRNSEMATDHLEYQANIYQALQNERYVVAMKSVQNGISEAFIISHLEEAMRGLSILYVLPKGDLRNTFVQNRINRLVKKVDFYKNLMKDTIGVDNVGLKGFGKGVIKYVSSDSESNFVEFPADALYIDELDQCNQQNLLLAPDRLESSSHKLIRKVANPTIEDYGIDVEFKRGTQTNRLFMCPHCNLWQTFDWFLNVVREIEKGVFELLDMRYSPEELEFAKDELRMYCRECRKSIDRFTVKQSWCDTYPSREIKSFHISKIFTPFTTIRELARRFFLALNNQTTLQVWYNSELGRPFNATGSKVTEDELNSTRADRYSMPTGNRGGLVYMGVDVGKVNNIVIRKKVGIKKIALYLGKHRDFDTIVRLIKEYDVKACVIDALPETREVEKLKEKTNLVWDCTFSRSHNPFEINKQKRHVTVRRTAMLDRVQEAVSKKVHVNPMSLRDVTAYYDEMTASTRVLNAETNPPEYQWMESKPDHYFLTEGYAELALEIAEGSGVFAFYEKIDKEGKKESINRPTITQTDSPETAMAKLTKKFTGGAGF